MVKIELSIRQLIVEKLESGKSLMQVSNELNVPKSTAHSIWKKYCATGSVINKIRSGRPSKTTEKERRIICRESKKNPFSSAIMIRNQISLSKNVSVWTIRRILQKDKLHGRVAARKPLLNKKQIINRLKWCKEYNSWQKNEWKKVIFSDESKIEIMSNRRKIVWRPNGSRYKKNYTCKTVRYCKYSLLVWGAIKADGTKVLIKCPNRLDSLGYQGVLDEGLQSIYCTNSIFMQDGAPCHRSASTINYLDSKGVCMLSDWPSQSPDLNIIENLWSILKDRISRRLPRTADELWTITFEEWMNIDSDLIIRLYESIPKRLQLVIKAKGHGIKY